VVVAAHDIQLRSTLTAADLRVESYDTNNVPPGAYASTKALVGQIAAVNFATGQPILQNLVSSSPSAVVSSATSYLPVAHGFVAVTIPSGEQQAVAGYVQPGDYISVIAVMPGKTSGFPIARTVFTNVHVIRTGPATASTSSNASGTLANSGPQGVSSSITIVMTQCDAEYMSWFLSYAQVKYTLESYQDYQSQSTQVDATCPAVTSARGVTSADVQRRWPGLLTG
jgi:pilus assembly protein CpaB